MSEEGASESPISESFARELTAFEKATGFPGPRKWNPVDCEPHENEQNAAWEGWCAAKKFFKPESKVKGEDPNPISLENALDRIHFMTNGDTKNECLIYLASPYSHPDLPVRIARFEDVCRCAAKILRARKMVYSPIAHCHPIAVLYELPTDFNFFKGYNRRMIYSSNWLFVLCIEGWTESEGVAGEIKMAREFDLPIVYVDPLLSENKNATQ